MLYCIAFFSYLFLRLFKGEQTFKFVHTFAQICHTFVTRTAAFGKRGVADLSDFADMWVTDW
jgi:hypothetical protein